MATATNDGPSGPGGGPERGRAAELGQSPFTFANAVTAARLLAVVPIVWLVAIGAYGAAFWVFLVAALSDAVDGFIAKRFNRRSVLGTWLDPAADKVLVIGCVLALVQVELLPLWLLALILARDVVLAAGALVLQRRSLLGHIQPLALGKGTTLGQLLLVALVLAGAAGLVATAPLIPLLIYAVTIMVVLSAAAYLAQGARLVCTAEKAS